MSISWMPSARDWRFEGVKSWYVLAGQAVQPLGGSLHEMELPPAKRNPVSQGLGQARIKKEVGATHG